MKDMIALEGYASPLGLIETEAAVKRIKDFFETALAKKLRLTRVSAPLFVRADSGLNDNLNGVERPVSFDTLEDGTQCEIVHSLAKWKRLALQSHGFPAGEGLYTDMNAIRRDEETDNLHSIYVDQWDWERVLPETDRNAETLQAIVRDIYSALLELEGMVTDHYPAINPFLPPEITFVTTQELEDRWPAYTAKERENAIAKECGAVFLMQIGGALQSGEIHDGRAPDYDDWTLNGDILVHYPLIDRAVELSSMGIRVNAEALRRQLAVRGCEERAALPFHQGVLGGKLPQSIGGGIGQSRLCMLFLQKAHIGEVQSSIWPQDNLRYCEAHNITLL